MMMTFFTKLVLGLVGLGIPSLAISARVWEVTVRNPLSVERKNVPVVIKLHQYMSAEERILSAVVQGPNGEIPSQLDDLDGDLRPEELVFVTDMPALAAETFRVTLSDKEQPKVYPAEVHAHIKLFDSKLKYPNVKSVTYPGRVASLDMYNSIYGHGALFESKRVGFRVYMDHRQSIDVYGKQKPQLELDRTNFYATEEDRKNGFGCDILWAGQSVGAGSFRGYVNNVPIYIDSVSFRGQTVRADGPVRAVVEVNDGDWWYGGKKIQMKQRYFLYAGHRDVTVEVKLEGTESSDLFCTGVQKLEADNEGLILPSGLVGSWGINVPEKSEPDHREGVGLGVCVDRCNLVETKEDDYNYLCVLRPDETGRITYGLAICALMEQGGFTSSQEWFRFLNEWRMERENPCRVAVNVY